MGVSPLQLVNLHGNRRYFVIKLHTWFCLSCFLKTNIKCYCIYQQFFQHRICFSIQPPDNSDPWPRLARSSSFSFCSSLDEIWTHIIIMIVCPTLISIINIQFWKTFLQFVCVYIQWPWIKKRLILNMCFLASRK